MEIRLQKRMNENRDRLYYTVFNPATKEYFDLFEFKRFKEVPTLEKSIFKCFSQTFNELFSQRNYDFNFYKVSLFLDHNISLNGKIGEIKDIEYKISKILKDIYLQLRWQDLFNLINSFKGKATVEGVEALREYLLKLELKTFSDETKKAFYNLKTEIKFTGDDNLLFKECIYLVIYDEYVRALLRTKKLEEKLEELNQIADDGSNHLIMKGVQLMDEIIALSGEEL